MNLLQLRYVLNASCRLQLPTARAVTAFFFFFRVDDMSYSETTLCQPNMPPTSEGDFTCCCRFDPEWFHVNTYTQVVHPTSKILL
ncbi:hypothetical protein B5X24_HaOG212354 [Helicoverpa armigera]|nr:hypothetical protein B5X24_HaOG212354 [Helicoverpa armigera]